MQTLISKLLTRLRLELSRIQDGSLHPVGVPDELAIEVDDDGSPVSKRPSEWFVCFVPGLKKQWWHRFTHRKHKHVFALKLVGDDQWILFESWWTRIMVTTLDIDEAVKFLRWGAAGSILRVTERIPGSGNQWRGWSNCSVLTSLMLGRSYLTWTPHGLFRRLSAEDGVEPVELADFLERRLISMTRRITDEALDDITTLKQLSPEAAFMELGRRISRMVFSAKYLSLCRFAISEASRFPDAAEAFFKHGPRQAETSVRSLISYFFARGRFRNCNQERTARAFLSMLRGNLHLEIVIGCRPSPDEADLESRTKSIVEMFLRGAGSFTGAKWDFEELVDMELREKSLEMRIVGTACGNANRCHRAAHSSELPASLGRPHHYG